MNRQIKFRVWIPEEKRFRYCDYIPTMGFIWAIDGTQLELGENYPQQFTGLKDKNGKEIYEGDILQTYKWDVHTQSILKDKIGKVFYHKFACRFSIATDHGTGIIFDLNTTKGGLYEENSQDELLEISSKIQNYYE